MKSWRFTGTNEPLQLTDLPEPTAGPGQVVVDVKAAGICHTVFLVKSVFRVSSLIFFGFRHEECRPVVCFTGCPSCRT